MTIEVIVLLIMFQLKHFLCDYPLQTQYMLQKCSRSGWIKPLIYHAGCHAIGTGLLGSIFMLTFYKDVDYSLWMWALMLLDFIIHFGVDRIKAHPDLGGKFVNTNPKFWWCLGADQMCHHLTHYFIIYLLVSVV